MEKRYVISRSPSAADVERIDWQAVPPLAVAEQQWVILDRPPEVEACIVRDDEALAVQFRVYEEEPVVRHRSDGDPVYEDSCVEFFLQPLPERDARYFNFEWNAAGALLLQIGENRLQRERIALSGRSFGSRAVVRLTDAGSGRAYWELAWRIPFAFVREWFPEFPGIQSALAGSEMRGNFYKCGDRTPAPHYLSWRKVDSATPDYHRSDSFGTLVLA